MATGWLFLSNVGHYAPLVPLLFGLWLRATNREPSDASWILIGAMMLSFLADQAGVALAGTGPTWWITYLYAPIQVLLWLVVGVRHPAFRLVMVALVVVVAGASAARGPLSAPETVVGVVGGCLAAFAFWQSPYRRAMWLYCLGTIPGLLFMGAVSRTDPAWLWGWGSYEVMRVLGLVALTWAVRQEAHGRRRGGQSTGTLGGGDRHPPWSGPQTAFTRSEISRVA